MLPSVTRSKDKQTKNVVLLLYTITEQISLSSCVYSGDIKQYMYWNCSITRL